MSKDFSSTKPLPEKEEVNCCPHCGHAIGDEPEGENPGKPERKQEIDKPRGFGSDHPGPQEYESQGDQEPLTDFSPAAEDDEMLPDKYDHGDGKEEGDRKKRKDDAIALLAAALSSKFSQK